MRPDSQRDAMPLFKLFEAAQEFVREHNASAQKQNEQPGGETFWPDYDAFVAKNRTKYIDLELKAICAYASAATGRLKRITDPVWRDSFGRVRYTAPPWPDDPDSQPAHEPAMNTVMR